MVKPHDQRADEQLCCGRNTHMSEGCLCVSVMGEMHGDRGRSQVCRGSSVASVNAFIGPTEMNSAGTACAITFYSPCQSFYSIVLLSPDFLSPYTARGSSKISNTNTFSH